MEHRNDLEEILLAGLPEVERRHVASVIGDVTANKLRHKRAQGVVEQRREEAARARRAEDAEADEDDLNDASEAAS